MAENFFGNTDLGKQRQNNEDTFIARQTSDSRYIVACVIDGVGGYSGGEIAAEIARETILELTDKLQGEILPSLIDVFTVANEKIWTERQSAKEYRNMACVLTLAIADLKANQFYYAHIGDTRLYLLRDGSLIKISHDHSFVGFLEDSGRLTEEDAMSHPKRNEIDKALGFKSSISADAGDIETGQSPFLPGDTLLLCSDGLTDLINKEDITAIMTSLTSLKNIGNSLIDAANNAGGKDNITVVLVKNNKSPQQHSATKPVEGVQTQNLEAISHQEAIPAKPDRVSTRPTAKTATGFTSLLLVIIVALAAICLWQYINYKNGIATSKAIIVHQAKSPNLQEIKLQDTIDHIKGQIFVLNNSDFKSPILLNRSIIINRDSLHIKVKGNIVLLCDSGFSGPAFTLSQKTKNITLDSLVFQNFNIAITGYNQALFLKNVRFVQCKIPLQNIFGLANNKYINGGLPTLLFKTDSLPKTK